VVVASELFAGWFRSALQGGAAEEALEARRGDFRGTFVVDVLLVVVEEFVFFLGEGIGLEVGCEGVVGRWIDVGEYVRLFTFVHYGGEVEGVGIALLSTAKCVSGWKGLNNGL
jgi:hypothetical protein